MAGWAGEVGRPLGGIHRVIQDWLKLNAPGLADAEVSWSSVTRFLLGGGLFSALRLMIESRREPNAVGPFGTPAAPFVIVRLPDGTRVIDDVVGATPEAQASILKALEQGRVCEMRVRRDG